MGNWINLFSERYLSADKMNAIYNNFQIINELLSQNGYAIFELTDNTVTYGINPSLILEKMNSVETNIQNVENSIDWITPYYKIFDWVHETRNKKNQVDRWINYLNFVYKVLTGAIKGSQYLVDKYNKKIVDQNGFYILVYKE